MIDLRSAVTNGKEPHGAALLILDTLEARLDR